jgi:hypothetical protein
MGTGTGWGLVLSLVAFVVIIVLVIVFPLQSMVIYIAGFFGYTIRTFILGFMDGFK